MANLRDVARAAGVSPATASRALARSEKVSAERRASVERAAAELGYVPRSASSAVERHSLGLVVPDIENPFFTSIIKAVQRRARAVGRTVLLMDSEEDPRLEMEILGEMRGMVSGVLLCSPRMPERTLAALPTSPEIILVNRRHDRLRSVVIDNQDGERQALRHLHALAHRRIAYAGGQDGSWSDAERRTGLEAAAAELPDIELAMLGRFPPVFAGGVAAADLVLASGVTAGITHNDMVALGVLDRLRARRVEVPGEISVMGFDDVPAAQRVSPALTTVTAPLALLARTAVDLLLEPATGDVADGNRSQVLPVALAVRDSTGPAPA